MIRIKSILSLLFARYIVKKNNRWKESAVEYQNKIMHSLVCSGKNTLFGKDHFFQKISSYEAFKKNIPVRDYEELKKYITLIKDGKKNILWPGKPIYFCKTSGTTSGTKFIPLTKESISCHLNPARDAILSYIDETKNTSIVDGKMIFLQGSPKLDNTSGILTGRLSGIVAHHIPFYLKKNRLPSFQNNCIEKWEEKVDAIVDETIQKDMSLISGIPPWVQMYFERLAKRTDKKIKDVFPNYSLFV